MAIHSLYRSHNIVRVIKCSRLRWAGHVARMVEGRSAFKILTGKPTGKRPLERPRRRWEDNIRMDLEEIGISAGNWVDSAQDRVYLRALVNAALNLRVLEAMELAIKDIIAFFILVVSLLQINFEFQGLESILRES